MSEDPSSLLMADDEEVPPAPTPEVLELGSLGGLPVSAVGENDFNWNMLIYGRAGVGKTRLAGSAQEVAAMAPVLVIDVEGGTLTLKDAHPDVAVVRVQTWQDMQQVYSDLYDGKHNFRTVVLDSLTELQKFSMYNIMTELVRKESDRDPDIPSLREWGKNIEQTRRCIRAFRDLPMNTIFTALEMQERNPRTGQTITKPALSGKLSNEVAGFVDIVTYYYVKYVDNELQRLLLTEATEDIVAKDRTNKLPIPIVQAPTMAELFAAITN